MDEILSQENKTLDILSTKYFLSEKFWSVRDKFQRFDYIISYSMLGFFIPFVFYNFHGLSINAMGLSLSTSYFEMFTPGVIGLIIGSIYGVNKRKNELSAFNSINNELGNEKLKEFVTDSTEYQYKQELTNQIEKMSVIKIQLESLNRRLETDYNDCLIKQSDKKLDVSNKVIKENLIKILEQYLPISYREFKNLSLDKQQKIIDEIKEQQDNIQKYLFQQSSDTSITDLEEDINLHLGLIEEDEQDIALYNAPKTLVKKVVPTNDDIED